MVKNKKPNASTQKTTRNNTRKNAAQNNFFTRRFKVLASIFTAVIVVLIGILLTTSFAGTSVTTYEIRGSGGKCLDDEANRSDQKNQIWLYPCNHTNAQKWTLHPGALSSKNKTIHLGGRSMCLDVKYAGTEVGTPVWLWTCNKTKAQEWQFQKDGTLKNPNSGLCISGVATSSKSGDKLSMGTCSAAAAQKWKITANTAPQPSPSPTPAPTPNPAPEGQQQTGNGITLYQNLSGSTFSKTVNAAGSAATVSLQPKTYSFSDFADGTQSIAKGNFAYGSLLKVKGLLGAGPQSTIIQMNPNTSKKAGDVPSSNCGGGPGCPTNNLYLVWMGAANAKVDGLTIRGTSQGHLYNGLRFEKVTSPVLSNSTVTSIPGDSSANPGETFAVNLNHATGTATVSNVTIDGGSVGAAGLGVNSCSATINITDLRTSNLKYSAGVALWQQTGTVNIRNFSSQNNARALGAERLGATVNIYDPNWSTPNRGHDITYTPYDGHAGRINFYFSSASKVPTRKIIILTNTASVKSTVHVYINNVEQQASKYITWQGA